MAHSYSPSRTYPNAGPGWRCESPAWPGSSVTSTAVAVASLPSSFSAISRTASGLTPSRFSSCQAAAIPTAPRTTPAATISVLRVIAVPPSKVSCRPSPRTNGRGGFVTGPAFSYVVLSGRRQGSAFVPVATVVPISADASPPSPVPRSARRPACHEAHSPLAETRDGGTFGIEDRGPGEDQAVQLLGYVHDGVHEPFVRLEVRHDDDSHDQLLVPESFAQSLLLILLQGAYIPYKHACLKMQIAVLVIGVLEGQGVQRHAPAVHVSRDGRPIFGPSFKGQVVGALRHDIRDVLLPQVAIDGPLLRHGWSSSPGSHAPPSRRRRSDHQVSREGLFDLVRVSE